MQLRNFATNFTNYHEVFDCSQKFVVIRAIRGKILIMDFAVFVYSHSLHLVETTIPTGHLQPERWSLQ